MFASHCHINYRLQKWPRDSLSKNFAGNFISFSIEDFTALDSLTRCALCDLLQNRGICVPKGFQILIPDGLYPVAHDEISWTSDEPDKQNQAGTTVVPRLEVNPKLQPPSAISSSETDRSLTKNGTTSLLPAC